MSPLWECQRLPVGACISVWVMQPGTSAVIPDMDSDDRIPAV